MPPLFAVSGLKNRQATAACRIPGFRVPEYRARNKKVVTIRHRRRDHSADDVVSPLYGVGEVIDLPIGLPGHGNPTDRGDLDLGLGAPRDDSTRCNREDGSVLTQNVHFMWTQINEIHIFHDDYLLFTNTWKLFTFILYNQKKNRLQILHIISSGNIEKNKAYL